MPTLTKDGLGTQLNFRRRIEIVIYLALWVAVAYVPLIGASWVYDDINLVQPSPALESFSGLISSISTDLYSQANLHLEDSSYWRPIAMASYWLNTRLSDSPSILHLVNILLHTLTAALLAFFIMRRHGGKIGAVAAVLVSAWWAFHPQNVEPVAWISCRYDLLCGVALLTLLVLPWRSGPLRAVLYGIIFLAGLLSKESFAVIAVVILAMDFAERRSVKDAAWRWGAIIIALGVWIGLRAVIGIPNLGLPPFESVLDIIRNYLEAIAIYLWRAFTLPPLTISHPYSSGGVLWVVAGIFVFVAFVVAVILRRRLALPVSIFLAGLVPTAGAMTMFHEAPERYFYIPSIGLALLIGELIVFGFSLRYKFVIRIAVPIIVGIMIILGLVQLELRLPDWRNDDKLWKAAIRVDSLDPLANHYQAIAAGKRNDWDGALRYIKIATAGNPNSGRFATTHASILLKMGDKVGAAKEAERATILMPYYPDGWYFLAYARHNIGDHLGELAALKKLLEIAPDYPGAKEAYEFAASEVNK